MKKLTRSLTASAAVIALGLVTQSALAQRLAGEELIRVLQEGGHVIVMNQAPSEMRAAGGGGRGGFGGFGGGGPGGGGEPQPMLTQDAENMLIGVRHALWHFKIAIDAVYTSPAAPATQHASEVPFSEAAEVAGLAEDSAGSGWLEAKLMEAPMDGSNAIIVTHGANIGNALGMENVDAGESVVVRPGAEPTVVGRLGLRDWSVLAIDLEP